jgi:hypothetical protein
MTVQRVSRLNGVLSLISSGRRKQPASQHLRPPITRIPPESTPDCTLSVGNSLSGKLGEHVVIDRSTGTLTGTFFTNDVPSKWELDYDGISKNPNCVVLVPPVAGSVFGIR